MDLKESLWKFVRDKFNISTLEEFEDFMEEYEGVDLGIFVSPYAREEGHEKSA